MIGFSALGHMIRDGWPPLGSTFLARLAGAAVIGLGLAFITDWIVAGVLALAVLAGFYTDAKHGEANKGDWTAGIISGTTSLAPLAIVTACLAWSPWLALIVVVGVLKPIIWQLSWGLEPLRWRPWVPEWAEQVLEPTRIAALMWGAIVGAILLFVGVVHGHY